jgi:hypothetical protein
MLQESTLEDAKPHGPRRMHSRSVSRAPPLFSIPPGDQAIQDPVIAGGNETSEKISQIHSSRWGPPRLDPCIIFPSINFHDRIKPPL